MGRFAGDGAAFERQPLQRLHPFASSYLARPRQNNTDRSIGSAIHVISCVVLRAHVQVMGFGSMLTRSKGVHHALKARESGGGERGDRGRGWGRGRAVE